MTSLPEAQPMASLSETRTGTGDAGAPDLSTPGPAGSVPGPAGSKAPGPVAYLVKMFPRLSETFVLNEILELRRRGVDLRLISLSRPTGGPVAEEAEALAGDTFYVPVPTRARRGAEGWGRVARDHLYLARRHPGRYLHALFLVARRFSPRAWKRFYQAGAVGRYCTDQRVTHLHAAFAHTPTSVAFWTSRLTGLPFSFAAHAKDLYLSDRRSLRRKIAAARFVFTCTQANGTYLRGFSSGTPIHVAYHGGDLARFARDEDGPGGSAGEQAGARPVILAVGRLVPKKGLRHLLEAGALLARSGVDFELVLVGDGPLRAGLEQRARELGLSDRMRFLGGLPPSEVRRMYRRAAVVALPSVILKDGDRDGVPNVLVEAMAMRVPVVSTTVSAIPELITHRSTGLLVPPESPERLAAALAETLARPDEAATRAARARADLERRFDLRRNSAVIAGLLERHRRPTRCLYVSMDPGVPVRGHKGASAHVRQVAEGLTRAGVDTRIVTSAPGPEEPSGNAVPLPIISVPGAVWVRRWEEKARGVKQRKLAREIQRLLYNLSLVRVLGPLLREVRPDFVYERYSLCAFATGMACRRRHVPWLLEVNAPLADEEARYRGLLLARSTRMLERWCLRHADHCFVVSAALRRWAVELGVHPDRVTVLPNGVDRTRFHAAVDGSSVRQQLGFGVEEKVVAFAGSLKPWHGAMLLLDAVNEARRRQPELRLVFIGEGPEAKALRRRTARLGLEDMVRFTGAVPHDRVPAHLRAADILAAPYLAQSCFYFSPLKVMEYLAVGRPVVASRLGQMRELIDDACGRLVTPGDVRELSGAIEELAADEALRGRLGETAAARGARHDWSERVRVVLETVAALRHPAPRLPSRVGYILKMFPRFSETFVVNEVLELERQGLEIRVFSMKEPSGPKQADARRVHAPVSILPRGSAFFSPRVAAAHLRSFLRRPRGYAAALWFTLGRRDPRAVTKFLQAGVVADTACREGIGHIHAHFASGPARVAKLAMMISGIPFSFTAHAKDLYWAGHHHAESHKMKKRVRLARFVVTVSRENERFLNSLGFRVKEGRIRTLYIGLCLDEFPFRRPSRRPPAPVPLVLGVGRLTEKKGFHILIEALVLLHRRGVRFRGLVAGEGPEEARLRELIRRRGLEGRVRLLGAVPLDRLRRRYYARARVLAQPCVVGCDGDRDGIPTVLLEAMALGVPVVSTKVSGIPEAITPGVDGFLTDAGDVEALADRIETLLADPARADEIALAARARVEQQFNLARNASSLRRLFQRSLLGWPARGAVSFSALDRRRRIEAGGPEEEPSSMEEAWFLEEPLSADEPPSRHEPAEVGS